MSHGALDRTPDHNVDARAGDRGTSVGILDAFDSTTAAWGKLVHEGPNIHELNESKVEKRGDGSEKLSFNGIDQLMENMENNKFGHAGLYAMMSGKGDGALGIPKEFHDEQKQLMAGIAWDQNIAKNI